MPVTMLSENVSDVSLTAGLDSVKTVVTYVLGQMGDLVTTIAAQPLLLIPTGFYIAGGCIALAKRLMH